MSRLSLIFFILFSFLNFSLAQEDKALSESRVELDSDLPEKLKVLPWVKPELYMTLADELTLMDPKDGIPAYSWLKPFLRQEVQKNALMEMKYNKFQRYVAGVDDLRRFKYIESYYGNLIQSLYLYANKNFPWSYRLAWKIQYDDNVTQSPDDQATASNESGVSFSPSLNLGYAFKKINSRQFKLGLQAGITEYDDSQFKTRETRNVGMSGSLEFTRLPWERIAFVKPELRYRLDWLNDGSQQEIGFETLSLGVQVMSKPWLKKHRLSEAFILLGIVSLDLRDYKNFLELGSRGDKRDAQVKNLTLLAVNIAKLWKLEHRSTMLLNVGFSDSDDPNQDYFSHRFSYQHMMYKDKWSFGPKLTYAHRDQDDYDAAPRRDNSYEVRAEGKYQWKPQLNLGLSVGYKKQDSTNLDFDYDNTYVAFEGQWALNFSTSKPYLEDLK